MITLDDSDRSEILRYLGYRNNEITEVVEKEIREAVDITNKVSDIRSVWKLFQITSTRKGLSLGDTQTVLTGKCIRKHLKGCREAILFCVTLGSDFDAEVEKRMITEPALGVIMNACGVALIEKACDDLQAQVDITLKDRKTGQRFSPGYGDLPLETQVDIIRILNCERTVGVRLNRNFLMNPLKSVTAIAGISEV